MSIHARKRSLWSKKDPNVDSCEKGKLMQQEVFHINIFTRISNADNLENNAEIYEQTPERNY